MTIQELKPSKRVRDRWLAVLEDGSILRLGKNQIADFALYAGRELSDEEADRLIQAVQTENFRAYALQTLLNGPKSRKMLLELLAKKDCPPEQAGEIADWLEEFGYLNDGAYAAELAQSCARRGYQWTDISAALRRYGAEIEED